MEKDSSRIFNIQSLQKIFPTDGKLKYHITVVFDFIILNNFIDPINFDLSVKYLENGVVVNINKS